MFKRMRYQDGCISREKRKTGPAVWIYRWRETAADGQRVNRKVVVGTVEQYRTESEAWKSVEALRTDINRETPHAALSSMTVEQLVAHYLTKEVREDEECNKAHSTRVAYRSYIKNRILPRWGSYKLSDVKTVAVEEWLRGLTLARGSKAKIRNIMSVLFNHAMRYEWIDKNPITLVRQSAKREHAPEVLEPPEIQRLLAELDEPYRTMVFLAASTGLRASELIALKWRDIDFEAQEINLCRSVVSQVLGTMKTEASRKPLPLDSGIAAVLLDWRSRTPFNQSDDWLFASPNMRGQQPYWPETLLRRHIRPAAKRAGITKTIGWHTLRHTYATLLKANGEDVKTVQELMRHANSMITLDVYTQAVTPAKRLAQRKVVEMLSGGAGVVVPFRSHGRATPEGASH